MAHSAALQPLRYKGNQYPLKVLGFTRGQWQGTSRRQKKP
jgi:hypothetical protein